MNVFAERTRRRMPSAAGFTLVELLLVVAILGILAGVVAVNVSGHGERARIAATRQSIANIDTAVRMYEVIHGTFPENLEQLTVGTDETAAPLKREALVDSWGTPFQYRRLGRTGYEIRSAGSDQSMNTDKDLTN